MLKRLMAAVLVVMALFGFSAVGVVPAYAGGIAMPGAAEEEQVEPEADPVGKMPVFEYADEEAKMPADEQPEAEAREKTWVWVVLGFVAAVFVTNL